MLLWFELLLFVNPSKWTFPLSVCTTLNVLMCSFDPFLYTCICRNDRGRTVKETQRGRVEDGDTNWKIIKYRKEGAKIQETSISLMDGSILETQTSEPDGGQARKQDSADEWDDSEFHIYTRALSLIR